VDFCLQLLSEYAILEELGEDLTLGGYFSSHDVFLNYRRNREVVLLRRRSFPHTHRPWYHSSIVAAEPEHCPSTKGE
jgi:hypothetical protein